MYKFKFYKFSNKFRIFLVKNRNNFPIFSETVAIGVTDEQVQVSSLTIIAIAILSILLLLVVIDFFCCVALDLGIFAALTRKKSDRASR